MERRSKTNGCIRVNIYVSAAESDILDLISGVGKGKARARRIKDLIRLGGTAEILIRHGRQTGHPTGHVLQQTATNVSAANQPNKDNDVDETSSPLISHSLLEALNLEWSEG